MKYLSSLLFLFFLSSAAVACDVPVFRYALERWQRDLYRVFVLHEGEMDAANTALAKKLEEASVYEDGNANVNVRTIDLSDAEMKEKFYAFYPVASEIKATKPEILLFYPASTGVDDILWQGKLNPENVSELLESNPTEQLLRGILLGSSATFLLVECEDAAKVKKARATVEATLKKLKQEIKLPEGIVQADGSVTGENLTAFEAAATDPTNILESGIPLKIDFNLVRLPNRKGNAIFHAILDKTHNAAEVVNEPKLYAFFGRGRFIGPVAGEGINAENLEELAYYLTAACSCQVKNQNPGLDFLTNLDWIGYLDGSEVVIDKELPPLIGVLNLEPTQQKEATVGAGEPKDGPATGKPDLLRNLLLLGGIVLAVILIGTLLLWRNK